MWQFLQPLFAALLGAALSLFGIHFTLRLWPEPGVWHQLATAAPQLVNVAGFLLCVALVIIGAVMVVLGVRRTRRRFAQLRRLRWDEMPERFDDTREQWA